MPKVTIWIREEDFGKWQAIPNKPEFISAAINGSVVNTKFIVDETRKAQEYVRRTTVKAADNLNRQHLEPVVVPLED